MQTDIVSMAVKSLRHGIARTAPFLKPFVERAVENSPKLLIAGGVATFVATIAVTAKKAPSIERISESYSNCRDLAVREERRDLWIEEAKELAPDILPIVLLGAISVGCFIGASSVQAKRSAAILAAYTALEKTVEANREALIEKLGLEEVLAIEGDAADRAALPPETDIPDGDGPWYRDYITGRFFKCDEATLRRAESEVNKKLGSEVCVQLGEFYYELGLDDDTPVGDIFGFEAGRVPLDVHVTTVHPGTPMEYKQMHYRYTVVNRGLLGI